MGTEEAPVMTVVPGPLEQPGFRESPVLEPLGSGVRVVKVFPGYQAILAVLESRAKTEYLESLAKNFAIQEDQEIPAAQASPAIRAVMEKPE